MRAIAFYLPQFHPIPENDAWWGKGFTEWSNVAKARPLFEGHYQPHLPSELGFYDLRLPEARAAQASLAREHGIFGFCYYHYWFNGRRVLDRPFREVLASGQPDFPFCLCWANENWTRRWDGEESEILLRQEYSAEDDIAHIRSLIPAFRDPRYIKVAGKPIFLVYRIGNLPDPKATVQRWRDEVGRAGLPGLYLANVESVGSEHGLANRLGLDAAVEFAPDWTRLPPDKKEYPRGFFGRKRAVPPWSNNTISSYPSLRDAMLARPQPDYLRYRTATPMWDNSARRKENAVVLRDSTPEHYKQWLSALVRDFRPPSSEEDFIFINAWNEWAEGNHLEPCARWGRGYLEATRRALAQK